MHEKVTRQHAPTGHIYISFCDHSHKLSTELTVHHMAPSIGYVSVQNVRSSDFYNYRLEYNSWEHTIELQTFKKSNRSQLADSNFCFSLICHPTLLVNKKLLLTLVNVPPCTVGLYAGSNFCQSHIFGEHVDACVHISQLRCVL